MKPIKILLVDDQPLFLHTRRFAHMPERRLDDAVQGGELVLADRNDLVRHGPRVYT